MKARITITLKEEVRDPEGRAIASALKRLGYDDIDDVRQGKHIEIHLKENDKTKAEKNLDQMCRDFLVNPVIENYRLSFDEDAH